jgi:hypothetical protein
MPLIVTISPTSKALFAVNVTTLPFPEAFVIVASTPEPTDSAPLNVPVVPVMLNPDRLVFDAMLLAVTFPVIVRTPLAYVIPPLPSLTLPS